MSHTHEALLRAVAEHKSTHLRNSDQVNIEEKLLLVNLGEQQLASQDLSELRQSFDFINECINKLFLSFDDDLDESSQRREQLKSAFLPVLLKRKRLVLQLIDTKVTDASILKIRAAMKHLQNGHVRAKIEQSLSWIDRKNQLLKKEYHSIAVVETERAEAVAETENSFNRSLESYKKLFSSANRT